MPGYLPHFERGQQLDHHKPRSLDAGSEPHSLLRRHRRRQSGPVLWRGCLLNRASEVQKGLVWAGTNDGKVWYTRDGGGHWNDVSKNISGLPPWGVVSKIEPSHFDAGTAYIAVDFHLMDNRDPWLYKTTDFGKTWTKIVAGLPKGPLA